MNYTNNYRILRIIRSIRDSCDLLTESIESQAKTYINSKAMNAGATFNAFGYGASRGPLRGVVAKKIIKPPKVLFFTFDKVIWYKCFTDRKTNEPNITLIQDIFGGFDLAIGVWQKKDLQFSAFLPSKVDSIKAAMKKYRPCFSNDIPRVIYAFDSMKLESLEEELRNASLKFEEDYEDFGIKERKIDHDTIKRLSAYGCLCGLLACESVKSINISILEQLKEANKTSSKRLVYIMEKEGEKEAEERLREAARELAHIIHST